MQLNEIKSEIVAIVDRDNIIIGDAPRLEMSKLRLIHRSTYVFLIDRRSRKFYVQKRSTLKSYCPGHWDVSFGGVVQKGNEFNSLSR